MENHNFHTHSAFLTPPLRGPSPNTAITFGTNNLELCVYSTVKKFDDTFRRFGTILAHEGQTDRGMNNRHFVTA